MERSIYSGEILIATSRTHRLDPFQVAKRIREMGPKYLKGWFNFEATPQMVVNCKGNLLISGKSIGWLL